MITNQLFDRLLNFLLGASWAIVLFGALITFKIFSIFGFSLSIFVTITFIFVSLFMVLVLDAFVVNRAKLEEMKKQTEYLKRLSESNDNNKS